MPAKSRTLSKPVPAPKPCQPNETLVPRCSLLRHPHRALGIGLPRQTLVAGIIAGSGASRGIFENIHRGWHPLKRDFHHYASAPDWLCHWPGWRTAARLVNGALESFSRYHRDARSGFADPAQRVLGPARALVVRAN